VRSYFGCPANYALLFLAAAVFAAASLAAIMSVQEPAEMARPSAALGTRDLLTLFRRSLGERNFRNYLAGRILLILGGGASGFYAIHFGSTEGGGLAESTIITLGMFLTLPQAIASYLFGRLGDRVGHKRGVVMGALAQAGSLAAAYLGTGAWACVASFALLGVTWASGWVSHSNMLFETCPHDHRAAHITVSNTVLSPLLFLVPLGMGRLMESVVGIRNGIGLSLIPSALGVLWMLLVVKDPRATRAAGGQSAAAAVAS
jgi:MFS family permease